MKNLSIIIPCYNEEESIPQLVEKLSELQKLLVGKYLPRFVFVDDGSSDSTYEILTKNLSVFPSAQILKHERNQNLGAALKTGIQSSLESDFIAFLDSDCTYEPIIILEMLKKIEEGADFVTVSPYHPLGQVEGVPEWRLFISKILSITYRIILGSKFHTYTAMVRIIKTDLVAPVLGPRNDFSFVAAMFIKAIHNQYKIVEVPTVLKVRKFGVSKINILKTIRSHLVIILNLILGKEL